MKLTGNHAQSRPSADSSTREIAGQEDRAVRYCRIERPPIEDSPLVLFVDFVSMSLHNVIY